MTGVTIRPTGPTEEIAAAVAGDEPAFTAPAERYRREPRRRGLPPTL
jgi:hypothetical protein